ncbi:protein of unknown function [Candidatus Promineifilum breve]|uniref:Uncharacterized protein n=1 Tax=Candidatus Promineifilum breve TaxID=1806508 RepID=A0A170PIU5_9CHLR|nr:protein of unknown function [Candidatus Promineifilum breve]
MTFGLFLCDDRQFKSDMKASYNYLTLKPWYKLFKV